MMTVASNTHLKISKCLLWKIIHSKKKKFHSEAKLKQVMQFTTSEPEHWNDRLLDVLSPWTKLGSNYLEYVVAPPKEKLKKVLKLQVFLWRNTKKASWHCVGERKIIFCTNLQRFMMTSNLKEHWPQFGTIMTKTNGRLIKKSKNQKIAPL